MRAIASLENDNAPWNYNQDPKGDDLLMLDNDHGFDQSHQSSLPEDDSLLGPARSTALNISANSVDAMGEVSEIEGSIHTLREDGRSQELYHPVSRQATSLLYFAGTENLVEEVTASTPLPTFQEMGNVDIHALIKSLDSQLPTETSNALDVLTIISGDKRWGLPLIHCAGLLESLVACLTESINLILACPTSGYLADCKGYCEYRAHRTRNIYLARASTIEIRYRSECIVAVVTLLKNLAFTEINQEILGSNVNLVHQLVRILKIVAGDVTSPDSLHGPSRLQALQDSIILLANIANHVRLQSSEDMLVILSLVSSSALVDSCGSIHIKPTKYSTVQLAIDFLAKAVSRNSENRDLLKAVLLGNHGPKVIRGLLFSVWHSRPLGKELDPTFICHNLPNLLHRVIVLETILDIVIAEPRLYEEMHVDDTLGVRGMAETMSTMRGLVTQTAQPLYHELTALYERYIRLARKILAANDSKLRGSRISMMLCSILDDLETGFHEAETIL